MEELLQGIESCKICGGLGTIDVKVPGGYRIDPCKCSVQAVAQKQISDAGIPRRFYEWDLRNLQKDFRIKNKEALSALKLYVEKIDRNIRNGNGLWVSSPPGLGKNALLCYILRLAIEKKYRAYFVRARHIVELKFDSWRDREARDVLYHLTEGSHIVAIADIEKGPLSNNLENVKVQCFYEVLSDIDDSRICLLVSSNLPKMEALKKMPLFMQNRFRAMKEIVLRYSKNMNGDENG
jgi:hypothetical protein